MTDNHRSYSINQDPYFSIILKVLFNEYYCNQIIHQKGSLHFDCQEEILAELITVSNQGVYKDSEDCLKIEDNRNHDPLGTSVGSCAKDSVMITEIEWV